MGLAPFPEPCVFFHEIVIRRFLKSEFTKIVKKIKPFDSLKKSKNLYQKKRHVQIYIVYLEDLSAGRGPQVFGR